MYVQIRNRFTHIQLLLLIASLSFGIRVAYLLFFGDYMSGPDADTYSSVTRELLSHGPFVQVEQIPFWPIGYPWFLAIIASPFGGNFEVIPYIQSALFSIGVLFFGMTLNLFFDKKIVVASSLLLAFNPALLVSSTQLMYEAPQVSLICIGFFLLFTAESKSKVKAVSISKQTIGVLLLILAATMQLKVLILYLGVLIWNITLNKTKKLLSGTRQRHLSLLLVVILIASPSVLILRNYFAGDGFGVSKNYQVHVKIGLSEAGIASDCVNTSASNYDTLGYIFCLQMEKVKNPVSGILSISQQTYDFFTPYVGALRFIGNGNGTWFHGIDPRRFFNENQVKGALRTLDIILSGMWMSVLIFLIILGGTKLNGLSDRNIMKYPFTLGSLLLLLVSAFGDGDSRYRLTLIPFYLPLVVSAIFEITRDSKKSKFTVN
jgi:hypothetical protein